MFWFDTCGREARDVEELAAFVSQLAALGIEARVHVASLLPDLGRNVQFDLAPYLADQPLAAGDRLVLLSAHRLTDEKLVWLRRLALPGVACSAFGVFETRQAVLGAKAKLSYVLGSEPDLYNLDRLHAESGPRTGGPVFGVRRQGKKCPVPRLLVVEPPFGDRHEASALLALALSQRIDVSILTDGRSKGEWQTAHGFELPIYHYGEVLPADLAERVDICVSFRSLEGNYRLQCLVANLAVSGATLLDATAGHVIAASWEGFVRAPRSLVTLAPFLETQVLPNLAELGPRLETPGVSERYAPYGVMRFLGAMPVRYSAAAGPKPRATIVPTNGVGLGHARRCALIAREFGGPEKPLFAAFPSCTTLIKSFGFDVMPLIGHSALHAQTFENDLANYLRIRALTAGGGTLVFDGGYIFDSIYRTILENRLCGVWIRRGLWQVTQNNGVALDREKIFTRVIVPREAFDELNRSYSQGDHIREVGPVVERTSLSPADRRTLHDALAERYGVRFERLVVSLLGGGVAANRGAQIQALCGMMERRADTLHLVVVWPGGWQEPAWFNWQRSRVVRTQHTGPLLAAADLCISAAGYNLFHEVLYNGVPTIFVPQTGPMMDDQRARALAASERGLAALVEPVQLLRLDREIARFLDGGEADEVVRRLAKAELPEPGNRAAAREIMELDDGEPHLFRDRFAHYTTDRG